MLPGELHYHFSRRIVFQKPFRLAWSSVKQLNSSYQNRTVLVIRRALIPVIDCGSDGRFAPRRTATTVTATTVTTNTVRAPGIRDPA